MKARLITCVICALAPAAAAESGGVLPFIDDDGGSYVDARGAIGWASSDFVSDSTQGIDARAQVILGHNLGVYGALGAAHEHRDTQVSPEFAPVIADVVTPLDAEVGGVLRTRDDRDVAFTLTAGLSLPAVVNDPMVAQPGTRYVSAVDATDLVRSFNRTAIRVALTASRRGGGFIAAAHFGVDATLDDPSAAQPTGVFDMAGAIGGETDGGTSFVFGLGLAQPMARSGSDVALRATVAAGFDLAQRYGRAQAYAGLHAGVTMEESYTAIVAGVRWAL